MQTSEPQHRALNADGEEVHVAAWPGSAAQARDIARLIALKGRLFVVVTNGIISADTVPAPTYGQG